MTVRVRVSDDVAQPITVGRGNDMPVGLWLSGTR